MSMNMQGKRVLVTGSGTGIGRGIGLEFAKEGASVAFHYSRSSDGARSAVEQVRADGGKAEAFQADLSKVEDLPRLAQEAAAFLGGIDVLVNNAGITWNAPLHKVTPEQYDKLFDVNMKAVFFLTQAVTEVMLGQQGGGSVVNITSGHAYQALTEHAVYASTRAAIVGFTRTAGLELIQKGIRMNAIASGWVLVENQRAVLGDDFDEQKAGLGLPAGFIGEPRDIARLAIFFASDDSRYIVGQTYCCDGGQSILMGGIPDFRTPSSQQWGQGYVPGS